MGFTNFIRKAVASNLKDSLPLESYFMNRMVEFLERLHF